MKAVRCPGVAWRCGGRCRRATSAARHGPSLGESITESRRDAPAAQGVREEVLNELDLPVARRR